MAKIKFSDKVSKLFTGSYTSKTELALAQEREAALKAAQAAEKKRLAEAAAKKKAEAEKAEVAKKKIAEASKPATPAKKRAPRKAAPKADARDGDGDGLVQDGTIWERPAPAKKTTPAKKPAAPRKKKSS